MIRDWNWKPQDINWGCIIWTHSMWISCLEKMLGSKCFASLLHNSLSLLFPTFCTTSCKNTFTPPILDWFPWTLLSATMAQSFSFEISFPSLLWWWGEAKALRQLQFIWVFSSLGKMPGSLLGEQLAVRARNQKIPLHVCEWNLLCLALTCQAAGDVLRSGIQF